MLGPVRLTDPAGQVHTAGGPLVRGALAALALADGCSVSDSRLIDELWGDEAPRSVNAALRVHVSALRAVLDPLGTRVQRQGLGYRLEPPLLTDVADVETLSSSRPHDPATLERCWRMWRGPSLADLRHLPLGSRVGPALDERRERLLNQHAEALIRAGRGLEASSLLEARVDDDVVDEQRWALLAFSQHQIGQPAVALRTIARARRALVDVAGLDPGPILRDAERRLFANAVPELRESASSTMLPRVPAELVPLRSRACFGRERTLSELRNLVDESCKSGRTSVVLVTGEAGVGKSRLLAELAHEVVGRGIHAEYLSAAGDSALLASDRCGGAVERDPDPMEEDYSVAWASAVRQRRGQLLSLAGRGPALWLLDDLQWLDDASVAAVRQIANRPVGQPLVFVAAARTGTSRLGARGITHFQLPRLDRAAVAACCRDAGVGTAVEAVWDATRGLAWLVTEAIGYLLGRSSGLANLRDFVLRSVDRERSSELDAAERTTLEWAAVLGDRLDIRLLECVGPAGSLRTLEHVDRLVGRELLFYDPSEAFVVRFEHSLLREATLSGIGRWRRQRMHQRVFDMVGSRLTPPDRLGQALSAGAALSPAVVVESALSAVRYLVDRTQFDEAKRVAETGIDVAGPVPAMTSAVRRAVASLRVAAARSSQALGHLDDVRRQTQSLHELWEMSGDDEIAVSWLQVDALFGERFLGEPSRVAVARDLLTRHDDGPIGNFARRRLAFDYLQRGELSAAQSVIASLDASDGHDDIGLVLLRHRVATAAGDAEARSRAVRRAEWLRASGGASADRHSSGYVVVSEALHRGDLAQVDQLLSDLITEAEYLGSAHSAWMGRAIRFTPLFLNGDHEAAGRAAADAHRFGVEHGIIEARGTQATQLFALAWAAGSLSSYVDSLRGLDDPHLPIVWRAARALALAAVGDRASRAEALGELQSMMNALERSVGHWLGFVGIAIAVDAASAVGDRQFCAHAEPLLRARCGTHVLLGHGVMDYGPVDRYHGLALASSGDPEAGAAAIARVARDPRSGFEWCRRAAEWINSHPSCSDHVSTGSL
jgi:DNA-binding SARP family transcriptional activator